EVRYTEGELAVRGVLRTAPEGPAALRLRHRESGKVLTMPLDLGAADPDGRVPFTARVRPTTLTDVRTGHERLRPTQAERSIARWDTSVLIGPEDAARPHRLALVLDDREGCTGAQFPYEGRALYARRSPGGYLQIVDQPAQPLVEHVTAAPDGTVTLTGTYPAPGTHALRLVLRQTWSGHEYAFPASAVDGAFTVTFAPAPPRGVLPLRSGFWWPCVERADGTRSSVQLAPTAYRDLPAEVTAGGKRVELQARQYDQLALLAHSELRPDERSRHRQTRLRERTYPLARREPLTDTVVYDVFGGRMYGDSPRALHEELVRRGEELEHLWVVKDGQCEVPATARALRVHSPEYYEALARSRYIVGNTHFPKWLERRPGQRIVQTWHGTPLKRIGFDFDNEHFASTAYLEDLDRERHQWSMLLSPNSFSTPILRRAFRYEGELVEAGYPRNDVLLSPDRDKRADEVRKRLGLPDGKKVILYAPTWREDKQRHKGGFLLDLRIDLDAAKRELGADHVLLIRPHSHVVEPVPGAGDGFVWDVSAQAGVTDVMDLLLVADVLITDYSSVMFDFAVTGRPMLFFTYDLEHYRDRLRGFYFDFEERAPGPLVQTSAELIAALRGLDAASAPYEAAYADFRAAFCDLDDGRAAARVVDRMLDTASPRASEKGDA
ncbi:CDP-glycerol glycerophosphotransferase family protein, partial [Streptomyces sp. SID14478]|uniref:CDP-glycerol glycerophosphotransferase family protein n=1 Tax=Streptomyces sp. SID14478 TaxID=2706073 RepID=UPI0013DFE2AD